MRRDAQAVLLLLVGATLLKISIAGTYVRYVKPGLLPLLLAAGVVLIAVAAVTLWQAIVAPRRVVPASAEPAGAPEPAGAEPEPAPAADEPPHHRGRGGHRRGRPVLDRGAALDRTAFDRSGQRRDQADWDVFEQTGDVGRFVSLALVHADDDGHTPIPVSPAHAAAAPTQVMPTITPRSEPSPQREVEPSPQRESSPGPAPRVPEQRRPAFLAPRRSDVEKVEAPEDDGHGHGEPRVGWLLLIPALALLMFAPPAIGSYQANRNGTALGSQSSSDFPPLPARKPDEDPLRITMLDYAGRAVYDANTLDGRRVTLTGFIIAGADGQPYLARMVVTCCAADARPIKIGLAGEVPEGLAQEQWVEVDGAYSQRFDKDPINGEKIPYLQVSAVRPIPVPALEYE